MTKQELVNEIRCIGFCSMQHAVVMTVKGNAVKTRESYEWLECALLGMTTGELELMLEIVKKANPSPGYWMLGSTNKDRSNGKATR